MQSAIFANKAFFVVLIAPVGRTIGVYSEPSFFDHFTVCRQMILIRDVVDGIYWNGELKRSLAHLEGVDERYRESDQRQLADLNTRSK